jgi:hypothetical protein
LFSHILLKRQAVHFRSCKDLDLRNLHARKSNLRS